MSNIIYCILWRDIMIKKWMEAFQLGYPLKENCKTFINKMITIDDSTVFLGCDLGEFAQTDGDIEALLTSQWQMDYDFQFESAQVKEVGKYTFIYTTALVSVDDKRKHAIEKASGDGALLMKELSAYLAYYGKKQAPVRVTVILDEDHKAHHIQFAYDALILWQYRFLNTNDVKKYYDMGQRQDTQPIRDLLKDFQLGYSKRTLEVLDEFMEMFSNDPNNIYIGTDADEFLQGPEDLKEIIESGWTYWGDFDINIEGAVIVMKENFAYFTTQAMIHKKHKKEDMLAGIYYYSEQALEGNSREAIISSLQYISHLNYEMSLGDDYFAPMRFSGYGIKEDDRWQFAHIQYSDYMHTPEKYI